MKKALLRLTDEELPLLMTGDGRVVLQAVGRFSSRDQEDLRGINPGKQQEEAFEWLRSNGHGDMVKNVVSVGFGMGEDSMAAEFKDLAMSKGLHPDQKESVHPSTLRAFVKDRVEEGAEFPMELFGAYIGQRAIIKGVNDGR